ncbi:MAG: Transcriptional regulatory protein QseF [Syntrophaceae bacterium PtaU1.Bin231]|nr:MAG: Transcriptional regulatory protein QseF [Syntrophaceae bacterium PtaU1.Bin231]HOG16264.1 sigma-54 dependent transcriptional regulator [Syntrophales bacterium]
MDRLLIVDDDLNILKVLQMRLESEGYQVETASDIAAAKNLVAKNEYDLAILDMKFSGGSGIDLMKSIREVDRDLPVIILTAYGTIEGAVEAMKEGAYVYLTKPFDYRELLLQIKNGIEKSNLSREVRRLRSILNQDHGIGDIVGRSAAMKRVFDLTALAAQSDSNVFISGESGTGKGMIARAVHRLSGRRDKPFVALNCAAIPETLLESELFGFEKGAFTGATSSKKGFFLQADGGTIFLDEISEIPLPMQGKLLKALEEKEFYPLGAQKTVKVDIRIVSASNRDIEKEVEEGRFRRDLFYRIRVIPIGIPPLRERKEDIPLLAEHFLEKSAAKVNKKIKNISPGALKKIMTYSWPGNVRELENVIECAAVMARSEVIQDDMLIMADQKMPESVFRPFRESKQEFERNYLIELMKISRGNVSQAAKLAGKYRADLYALLEKYNLNPLEFRQD